MDELNPIRDWLNQCRGTWSSIAARAGVSTKTLQRIANGDVCSVNLRTYVALRSDMDEHPREPAEATDVREG